VPYSASSPNGASGLSRVARGILGDWQVSLIYQAQSGFPFTISVFGDTANAGSLLNVKPILELRDGVVEPVGRVRGRQKALEEFARLFTEDTEDREGLHTAIAHANAPEWVDVLTDLVTKTRPKATVDLVQLLGAVVGTHAGPGAVGFFWFQD